MKNYLKSLLILSIAYSVSILRLSRDFNVEAFATLNLPAGFPSLRALAIIWAFLCVFWALGSGLVFSVNIPPRRKRNIFLNCLVLAAAIFFWHYEILIAVNTAGALALSIANLLLALIVWVMFLVIHRTGGYLFLPVSVWLVYCVYLSIDLFIRNH